MHMCIWQASLGTKGRLPQVVPLWRAEYFELKTVKAQKNLQGTLTSLPVPQQLHKKWGGGGAPGGELTPWTAALECELGGWAGKRVPESGS